MMINGAEEIISGVPGKHLDPLLLAQSQTTDSINLMVIAYDIKERFFDLLFLRGSKIYDCARMNQDIRFRLQVEKIISMFKSRSIDEGTCIHFYKASQDQIEQFRSTFYYEPCLKIQLESLTKKNIQKLLSGSTCRNGIIECNDFSQSIPKIDLTTIHSNQEILSFVPSSMKGRLLLYDIDKNNELIQERYDTSVNELPLSSSSKPKETFIIKRSGEDGEQNQQSAMLNEANQFSELIKQILEKPQEKQNDNLELDFPAVVIKSVNEPKETEEQPLPKRPVRRVVRKQSEEPVEAKKDSQPEIVVLFERIFRSFRRVVYECLGEKGETLVAQAESQARLLHSDFSLSALTETNAIVILDVVETVTKNVPLLKRSRVRNAVTILVADAYNKQYELLEKAKVLDRFEQFYYELKR